MPLARLADELLDKTVVLSYTNIGYALRRPFWKKTEPSMQGTVCLVTGANSGLGKNTTLRLAGLGATVYMFCRNPQRGEVARAEIVEKSGNEQVFLEIVDLGNQASIRDGFRRLLDQIDRLDVLINNAGALLHKRQTSADGLEMTFAVNTLGYFLLTELLLPLLKTSAPSRVLNVSSGGMYLAKLDVDDLQFEQRPYDGVQAYAASKRAEVLMTLRWAEQWQGSGVLVHALHPGWADTPGVATTLPGFFKFMKPFLRTPAQGADTIVWLAARPDLADEENGLFWFDRQPRPIYKWGSPRNTPDEIERFFATCHALTGIPAP